MPPSSPASPLTALTARDLDSVKQTLSSWDSCMAQSYCKWPVVAAIIVGSLILLSLIFCCARCLCCGLECCFGCFSCCNACCPSPRNKRKDRPSQPSASGPWNTQYQPQGFMGYSNFNNNAGPQFAQFDVSSGKQAGCVNEDSLPSMPSWQNATSRRVENPDYHEEEVELEKLNAVGVASSASAQNSRTPSDEAHLPMLSETQSERGSTYRHDDDPLLYYSHDIHRSQYTFSGGNGQGSVSPVSDPYTVKDGFSASNNPEQNPYSENGISQTSRPSGYHSPIHAQTFPLMSPEYQQNLTPLPGSTPGSFDRVNMRMQGYRSGYSSPNSRPSVGPPSYATKPASPIHSYTHSPPQAYRYLVASQARAGIRGYDNQQQGGNHYNAGIGYVDRGTPAGLQNSWSSYASSPSQTQVSEDSQGAAMPDAGFHGGQAYTEGTVPPSLAIGRKLPPGN